MSQVWTAEDYAIFEEVCEKMAALRQQRRLDRLPLLTRDEQLAEVQKITKDYMSREGLRRRLVGAKKEIERLKAELATSK